MKKEKGFTLIELLAVIVILAVIALIATPTILSIINRSRKGAAESSMLNYVETIEKELMLELVNDSSFAPGGTYTVQNKTISKDGKTIQLELKGELPNSNTTNTVEIDSIGQVVSANLKFGDYYVHYEFNENNATYCSSRDAFKTCNGEEIDTPQIPEVKIGPTSENPSGEGYTGVKKIVYLDPTDLTKECNASNVNSATGTKEGCMKWYAYAETGTTYTMLLDHNTEREISSFTEVENSFNYNWKVTPRLITAYEITDITGKEDFDSTTNNSNFYFDTNTKENGGTYGSQYAWLYDNTDNCEVHGCHYEDTSAEFYYWTSTAVDASDGVFWFVYFSGGLFEDTAGGLRPVITIDKSLLN